MTDVDDLAIFVRVADELSFSTAARTLGVPPSTVSRAITRLEDRVGVRLFQRTTRAVALTRDGEQLRARVRGPIAELQAAVVDAREGSDVPRGALRITAPTDLAHVVGSIVATFVTRYPEVTVEARLTAQPVDLVAEGVDLAIRSTTEPNPSHVARKILETGFYLYAAPSYLAAHPAPQTIEQLAEHTLVLFRHRDQLTLSDGTREVRLTTRASVVGDDFTFVHAATRAGAGIGVVPPFVGCPETKVGALVAVLPEWSMPGGPLYIEYPAGRNVPAKVAAFRDHTIQAFRDAAHVCMAPASGNHV